MDATFQQRAEQLRGRLDAPEPTTWRPDGDDGHPALLIGELVSVTEGTTSWGDRQIVILKDAEGALWNVWLLHAVLIGEFVRQQPKIGEMLAIRYEGRVTRDPSQGAGYEKYRLLIDRPGAAVAWKDVGTAIQPAAAPVAAPAQPSFIEQPQPQAVEPEVAAPVAAANVCPRCQFTDGFHAKGCPDDIPF